MHQHRLQVTAARSLTWTRHHLPPVQAHELLVRTIAGAISIGAELPQVRGDDPTDPAPVYPKETGYESYATVLAVGDNVTRFQVGDRLLAFYGHQDVALVEESKAIPVPDGISPKLALLNILSCDAAKGVRKLAPRTTDSVLVTGMGVMGLLTVFYLRHFYHVDRIVVFDPDPVRSSLALSLGAHALYSDTDETFTHALECSARQDAFVLLQEKLVPHGQLCILSDGNHETLSLTPAFYEKELRLVGSSDGWDYQEHAAWFFKTAPHVPRLEHLFEQTVASNDLAECFERLLTDATPLKVLVLYPSVD
ncbi:zinc-binding alcohol dehydrogenase [Exiguobacterium sp. RIT594]|uniref:zinc-dependent alcohol dehydrogenase n=1 Tax=Exiguobacterium sp. RIT594 TaxID=2282449 RepID=UPI000DF76328|nr:zinc-binding alcohol dehydrogenase [Exiguobacterium sp. RIT594]RDB33987.1 alcohol dehydrogenase [Exiguobacterium sp. RIT594]